MFYHRKTNQYINEGQPFQIDDTSYPSNWLNGLSLEEKIAFGLEEVTNSNEREDDRFYWVSENLNGNVRNYVNTPKDLTDVKTNAIAQTNNIAYTLLFPTDWMVVKAFETSTKVPTSWNTWRAEVRTTATNVVSMIEAAPDVSIVAGVMGNINWPKDPDTVALEAAQAAGK